VQAAYRLYAGILDEIERSDYQVLDRRISVPGWRRAALAAPALANIVSGRPQ
jgi:phytoene synthase